MNVRKSIRYHGRGHSSVKKSHSFDYNYFKIIIEDRSIAKSLMRNKEKHCAYCGDWYECRDHIIPVCATGFPRKYTPGTVIPCCDECNKFLGSVPIFNIAGRAEYLIDIYVNNRIKILKFPKWSNNEIVELGYNIRTSVERMQYLKKVYEAKISNLFLVSNFSESIPFQL